MFDFFRKFKYFFHKNRIIREINQYQPFILENVGNRFGEWVCERVEGICGEHHYYENLHYRRKRGASCILILPGLFPDGRIFFQLEALAKKYRIIIYEYPESSKYYRGDVQDFCGLLDDFKDSLRLGSFHLLGYSIGGTIALHWLGSRPFYPARTLSLISSGVMGGTQEIKRKGLQLKEKLNGLEDEEWYLQIEIWIKKFYGKALRRDIELSEYFNIRKITFYRQVLNSLYQLNHSFMAKDLNIPVTSIHGTKDKIIPIRQAMKMFDVFPQGDQKLIPKEDDLLIWKHGEDVSEMLLDFLGMHPIRDHEW